MRRHAAVLLAGMMLLAFVATHATAADAAKEAAAKDAASQWLALVDAGKYDASWDRAASLFKSAVTKDQWTHQVQAARAPLGKVVSRKLKSATYATSLPGAPDGQYVVVQYDTSYEQKKSAVETVTPMLDKDGQWRVSGYFIR